MSSLRITVFSDFSCPYSYVTESSLRKLAVGELEIVYRAFELFPEPAPLEAPAVTDWEALSELAAAEELDLVEPKFRPRTRKAHEASRLARDRELEAAFRNEVFAAYWSEERDIGRIDVLMDLAERVGLDGEDLKIALDIDRFTGEVGRDLEVGQRLRIPGSPTIFLGTGASARVVAGAFASRQLRDIVHDTIRTLADEPHDG
ncbi:MAG: DsbA family protein [Gemmatimonadota bacterium]